MSGFLVVFKKELMSYCISPVSWIIAVIFYVVRGFEVYDVIGQFWLARGDRDLVASATFGLSSTFVMTMLVPGVLTMKCFAEERRTGSMETLMTAPVKDGSVIFAKWFAATTFFSILWLPSVVVLHVLEYGPWLDSDLAFGPVFSAYLGMFLLSGMLLAFGVFASSLTDNVLLAAMVAIIFNIALIQQLPLRIVSQSPELMQNYYVRELMAMIDVAGNFGQWFARGLIDTSQVVFYIGGIGFFLFLTGISLASRRIA